MMDNSPYYYGQAENKLNSKGQVAIPARFRSNLPDTEQGRHFVIVRGELQCLYMYTHQQFGTIKNNARQVAEKSGDPDFYRTFMAEAHAVELDTQGRFVLPQHLMRVAGIAGPGVLFVGVDDRIEIWEPAFYASRHDEGRGRFEELRRSAARSIFGI